LLADNNDVRDVIIVRWDHISCVFDGLPNNNTLGIPANGTADKKFERVLFYCTEVILVLSPPAWARNKHIYNILIYELTLTH